MVIVLVENKHRRIAFNGTSRPTCHKTFLLKVADEKLDVVLFKTQPFRAAS